MSTDIELKDINTHYSYGKKDKIFFYISIGNSLFHAVMANPNPLRAINYTISVDNYDENITCQDIDNLCELIKQSLIYELNKNNK